MLKLCGGPRLCEAQIWKDDVAEIIERVRRWNASVRSESQALCDRLAHSS